MRVWVLISNNHCCGVFVTRQQAEREAEAILGGVARRAYEDWVEDWKRGDGVDDDDIFYQRDTDCGVPFILRECPVVE